MGWDAYATWNGEELETDFEPFEINFNVTTSDETDPKSSITNPKFRVIFKSANKEMESKCGRGDAYLLDGSLGGGCRRMLEQATGEICFDIENKSFKIEWSPERVKKLYETSNWDFSFYEEELDDGYYWAARIFLKTCAEHGFGILHTW